MSKIIYLGVKGSVVAINSATGQAVWSTTLKAAEFVNVVLDGNNLFATTRGEIFCLDPQGGGIRWHNPLKGYGLGLISIAGEGIPQNITLGAEKIRRDQEQASAAKLCSRNERRLRTNVSTGEGSLETKFEYQVSPELAEAIAIEQFEILFPKRLLKLRYLPVTIGFLFAVALLLLPSLISSVVNYFRSPYSMRYMQVGAYAFTDSFLFVPIGFVFGFGFGLLFNKFIRAMILAAARSAYRKMGPTRTISWNAENITFQSIAYEIKIHWQTIDKIEVENLGIYGVSGRRALFAIPKEAFPPNVTTEELTQAWRNRRMQPQ